MAARIKTFIRITSMTLALSLLFCGVSAAANVPYPRVKPQAPNISQVLSKSDAIIFKKGIAAAERRYWRDVDG